MVTPRPHALARPYSLVPPISHICHAHTLLAPPTGHLLFPCTLAPPTSPCPAHQPLAPPTSPLPLQDHARTAQRGAKRSAHRGRPNVILRPPDGFRHRLDGRGGRPRPVQVRGSLDRPITRSQGPAPGPCPIPGADNLPPPPPGRATAPTAPTSCSTGVCAASSRGAAARKSWWGNTAEGISWAW